MAIDTTLIEPAAGRLDIGSWPRRSAQTSVTPTAMPYVPALDGLRALAVVAVLLYHGDVSWMPGGFLGVEVFFVISGYLITALLLAERQQHRRHGLPAVLGPARPTAAARAVRRCWRAVAIGWLVLASRRGGPHPGRSRGLARLRHELVPDRRRAVLRRGARSAVATAPPVVARGRGAVLPGVARWRWPCCVRVTRGRRTPMVIATLALAAGSAILGGGAVPSPGAIRCGRTTAPTPEPPACCSAPRWPSRRRRGRCAAASPRWSRWLLVAGRGHRSDRHRLDVRPGQRVRSLRLPRRLRPARPLHARRASPWLVHPGVTGSVGASARARLASAGVDRPSLVRHLPVALADLRAHPAGPRRRPDGLVRIRLATARRADRPHPRGGRAVLRLHRDAGAGRTPARLGRPPSVDVQVDPGHGPVPPEVGRGGRRRGRWPSS